MFQVKNLHLLLLFLLVVLLNWYFMYTETALKYDTLAANGFQIDIANDSAFTLKFFGLQKKLQIGILLFYPFYLLIKVLVIYSLIDLVILFIDYPKLPLKLLCYFILLAEMIFTFPHILNQIWQQNWSANPYLPYLDYSLLSFIVDFEIPFALKYLAHNLNIFELFYILALVIFFSEAKHYTIKLSAVLIFRSYGIGMLLWSLMVGLYLSSTFVK